MSMLPWIGAGAYELGRRAVTSPLFWNALQLYLYGEQEIEIHRLEQQLADPDRAARAAQDPCRNPPIGSGEWIDAMEHLETEAAAWPEPRRCCCEDCNGDSH